MSKRRICLTKGHEDLLYFFFFFFLALPLESVNYFWNNICAWCEEVVQLHSVACGWAVVPYHCWRMLPPPWPALRISSADRPFSVLLCLPLFLTVGDRATSVICCLPDVCKFWNFSLAFVRIVQMEWVSWISTSFEDQGQFLQKLVIAMLVVNMKSTWRIIAVLEMQSLQSVSMTEHFIQLQFHSQWVFLFFLFLVCRV